MKPSPRVPPDAFYNQLLAALPPLERNRWQTHLEFVELTSGQVLCESGQQPEYAYFPTTAIISLVCLTEEGGSAEIAVVGREGLVGVSLFLAGHGSINAAVVQSAGFGYRVRAQFLRDEAHGAGPVLDLLLRYTLTMLEQVAQTAACHRYHSIDQLLCRRLLLGLDRQVSNDIVMTQELAARLLGVRREGVTAAAKKLQRAGVISYRRGRIAVLDRGGLEERTCN
ncbi:MAG: Crp/Fnr family transcriptional regulator [Burkholderiales bacterium]